MRVFFVLKIGGLGILPRILTFLPEVVAASVPQTLPSTRAGGQDDGSLTNSLKLLDPSLLSAHGWDYVFRHATKQKRQTS